MSQDWKWEWKLYMFPSLAWLLKISWKDPSKALPEWLIYFNLFYFSSTQWKWLTRKILCLKLYYSLMAAWETWSLMWANPVAFQLNPLKALRIQLDWYFLPACAERTNRSSSNQEVHPNKRMRRAWLVSSVKPFGESERRLLRNDKPNLILTEPLQKWTKT